MIVADFRISSKSYKETSVVVVQVATHHLFEIRHHVLVFGCGHHIGIVGDDDQLFASIVMDARTDHVLWFLYHSVWQTVDSGADISDRACISLLSKQDNRPYML